MKKWNETEIMEATPDAEARSGFKPSDINALTVYGEIVRTVRTAEIICTEKAGYVLAYERGWCRHDERAHYFAAAADATATHIMQALAAKSGRTMEEQRNLLQARVEKKAKAWK